MKTAGYVLSGALLGAATMGLMSHAEYLDAVGAVAGGITVLVAKLRHIF
jgi:hypothetical protein